MITDMFLNQESGLNTKRSLNPTERRENTVDNYFARRKD
jgi:hypothetical protein